MHYWEKTSRIIYSNLLDLLKAEKGMPSSGSVIRTEAKGKTYLQHRVSYEGERLTRPIDIDGGAIDFKDRMTICSMLTVSGCNLPDRVSTKTIELLDALGCFAHQKCVLIGSHAFNAIGNSLGVTWDANTAETKDIDLGRMVELAGNQSRKIQEGLLRAGFRAIPQLNRKYPPTNFIHKKNKMKIDFLTPMVGKPDHKPVLLQGAGVYAEPLRFLDYLIKEPQEAVVLTRNGVLVSVPQSARYALHKCVIYQYRRDDAKREKDLLQAESILTVLEDRMSHLIINAWRDFPWKDKAMVGISAFKDVELKNRLLELVDAAPG